MTKKFLKLAPLGIPVYNRLDHTKKMINSLLQNELASMTEVYFFCDNYKNEKDKKLIEDVRSFIFSITGFKKKSIILRQINYGLYRNTIEGINSILEKHEKFIWLEDDIVVSEFFLNFMNESLNYYENEDKVMSITGYAYPIKRLDIKESVVLTRLMQCWSWGSWKKKWKYFRKDKEMLSAFNKQMINDFNFDGTNPNLWKQVQWNFNGKINTWAIFWYASIFLKKGLCVIPIEAYAINIGHDGSGHHTQSNNYFDNKISKNKKFVFTSDITENKIYFNRLKEFFVSIQPTFYEKIIFYVIKVRNYFMG